MRATGLVSSADPAWLRPATASPLLRRDVEVLGAGTCATTVREEVARLRTVTGTQPDGAGRVVLGALDDLAGRPGLEQVRELLSGRGPEAFAVVPTADALLAAGATDRAVVHAFHHLVREGEDAFGGGVDVHAPANALRMLDHWDNLVRHEVMGTVERGYAGDSIFWTDGALTGDLDRVADYARLVSSVGINAVSLNNVNVHAAETRLLTDRVGDVATLADIFRRWGVTTYLSVNFAAPLELGGASTADPLDPDVVDWWRRTTDAVYRVVPDFGGYVVKADSENRPGPFTYGRDHADGANLLAGALAPHGGLVLWRCFVYDCHQDWRDRSTDRARAAYDHFVPLDGRFADNVVLQVKNGPLDFQTREPVSPLFGGMESTNLALELQITQEYTGHQKHVCWLVPQWAEYLSFPVRGEDRGTVADVVAGRATGRPVSAVVAVANVGDHPMWTGHPFAQANLHGFGRLAWDPTLPPERLLAEWTRLTYADPEAAQGVADVLAGSWRTYEKYTAPLGVGFMVVPGTHYGPSVDGYEYSPWGTYHFADRDGVGVDRTVATGTGYTAQYREPWASMYEDVATCPDELLLFFHHVPYGHVLHSGRTVVQHVYDTHFEGVEEVEAMAERLAEVAPRLPADVAAEATGRMAEQLRSAREWRDQVNTYFLRKSGVGDDRGRHIHP